MGYKYTYKRGSEKNPIPDYHKKYIEVKGKKVMTTRYTYEIALSKHWPDRSECTGPRGGKAVREFARYVWYADGMFYAVKRKCTGEDRFGNELVPLSGVIWDCHKAQTEAQGIPVVEITLKDGRPVSVLMDGDNIEVTDENWPIAEELLYLNGARCPRSANKQPSKPRKRAQRKAAPKAEPKPTPKPIVRPEDEFMKTFEQPTKVEAKPRKERTNNTLYVAFSDSPYKFWVHKTNAVMLMTNDKARFDKFVAKHQDAMVCENPNDVEQDECYARLAVSFASCNGELNLYGYDQDRHRVVSHKLGVETPDDELLNIIGRMFGKEAYRKYDDDGRTDAYEVPSNCVIRKPLRQGNPKRSDDQATSIALNWLNNKHHKDVWVADYAKRQGKTEKEVWDELIANWSAPIDYARFDIDTPDRLGTFDGYRLSACIDGRGDDQSCYYTVITPWGLNEGLWTPSYRDDEHAIELLKEVIAVIDDRMGLKAAA